MTNSKIMRNMIEFCKQALYKAGPTQEDQISWIRENADKELIIRELSLWIQVAQELGLQSVVSELIQLKDN